METNQIENRHHVLPVQSATTDELDMANGGLPVVDTPIKQALEANVVDPSESTIGGYGIENSCFMPLSIGHEWQATQGAMFATDPLASLEITFMTDTFIADPLATPMFGLDGQQQEQRGQQRGNQQGHDIPILPTDGHCTTYAGLSLQMVVRSAMANPHHSHPDVISGEIPSTLEQLMQTPAFDTILTARYMHQPTVDRFLAAQIVSDEHIRPLSADHGTSPDFEDSNFEDFTFEDWSTFDHYSDQSADDSVDTPTHKPAETILLNNNPKKRESTSPPGPSVVKKPRTSVIIH